MLHKTRVTYYICINDFLLDYVVKNRYRDCFAVTLIGIGFYVGKKWQQVVTGVCGNKICIIFVEL